MRIPEQVGYLGKKGGGKTANLLYHEIIKELVEGQRDIVTNLPLFLESNPNGLTLSEYLQRDYPQVDCRCLQRVRVLTREETKEFWRHRGRGADGAWWSVPDSQIDSKRGWVSYEGKPDKPVLYAISELHLFFNARAWTSTGLCTLFYASQLRHFSDRFAFDTQNFAQVDSQLRNLTDSYRLCRNRGRMARLRYFRGKAGCLEWVEYDHYPPKPGSFCQDRGQTQIDSKGWSSVYNTAGGSGSTGKEAGDKGETRGRIPMVWLIPLGLVFFVAIFALVPRAFGWAAHKAVSNMFKAADSTTKQLVTVAPAAGVAPVAAVSALAPVPLVSRFPEVKKEFLGVVGSGGGSAWLLCAHGVKVRAEFVHESAQWAIVRGEVWKLVEIVPEKPKIYEPFSAQPGASATAGYFHAPPARPL